LRPFYEDLAAKYLPDTIAFWMQRVMLKNDTRIEWETAPRFVLWGSEELGVSI
jgi:hypothetical protein